MLFSSISFLYVMLPATALVYFLAPARWKNAVLLAASLLFYFAGDPAYTPLLAGSALAGWGFGLWIDRTRGSRWERLPRILAVLTGIGLLVLFKYADSLAVNLSVLPGIALRPPGLALPLGISFYTFQILSYTIDVGRSIVPAQRRPVRFLTYAALFPQLIAGPIVRYKTVVHALARRVHSLPRAASGLRRFVLGLGKKVLIANTLGELAEQLAAMPQPDRLMTWLVALAFPLQIYFDFSAYSDMAIGLGRVFGFSFPENFRYPFTAASITEFWRRWHISLGTWFRDYVYIPLGGSRVGPVRRAVNLLTVWTLTGLWHGAQWQFAVWGLFFGVLLILEKSLFRRPARLPAWGRLYTLPLLVVSFVLFRADSLPAAVQTLGVLLGAGDVPSVSTTSLYLLGSYLPLLLAAAVGATPLPGRLLRRLRVRLRPYRLGAALTAVARPAACAALLLLCTAWLVDGSFNPFLYFRF